MKTFPMQEDEEIRLKALRGLHILDTPPEERFDAVTRIAKRLFDVEVVSIVLLDKNRLWFKSRQGPEITEVIHKDLLQAHRLINDDILVINDTAKDPRFSNPVIRFYAGFPLKTNEGSQVGAFCLFDTKPKTYTAEELHILKDLATLVEYNLNSIPLNEALEKSYKMEKALKERRVRYKLLLDNIADSIIVIDTTGTIQSINLTTEKNLEYSAEECVGKNVSLFFPQYSQKEMEALIEFHAESHEPTTSTEIIEVSCHRKNGGNFSGELTRSSMTFEDKKLYIWILRDTTERKKIELMKQEFISNVSHELRTPMTAIRGSLGLVLGTLHDAFPENARNLVEMAYSNSERLVRLVSDILDVEKMEAGMMNLQIEKLDLAQLIEQSVEALKPYSVQYGVNIAIEKNASRVFVNVDKDRITQVLTNLLSNAIKYSPRNETVIIRLENVEDKLQVSVIDRGPGISKQDQDRLFQKFTQLDSFDKRPKEGTGLGLSISKSIVEKHNGEIGCESELGKGSKFYFVLDLSID